MGENAFPGHDTQALLLLCGRFGKSDTGAYQPLTLTEYNRLEQWLHEQGMQPSDLLDLDPDALPDRLADMAGIDPTRLASLLRRGAALAFAVEQWTNTGLWVLGRADAAYPDRLRHQLNQSAPVLLFGAGDPELLGGGGLAIVGSRDPGQKASLAAHVFARSVARSGIQVISGGARGIDSQTMTTALDEGGSGIGVLAHGLARATVSASYRDALRTGNLVLISPYGPDAGFSAGNAMGRNKIIYGFSDWALVVASGNGTGGTWTGASENLQRGWAPLLVWNDQGAPDGNRSLVKAGGIPIQSSMVEGCTRVGQVLDNLTARWKAERVTGEPEQSGGEFPASTDHPGEIDLFLVVWPVLERYLQAEWKPDELAATLSIRPVQLRGWLTRALEEGKAEKLSRPVRYIAANRMSEQQLRLFE